LYTILYTIQYTLVHIYSVVVSVSKLSKLPVSVSAVQART